MRETLVVGTAGHIDHGKTSLIKHLTGIDADRLIDEKKRGITIDLGFAYLKLNNSKSISFVDVPGHERFIKNMLAGAMGMDAVMIVVAADEGFMPQTFEHLHILSHLNIKNGLVVLTKCDLVDEDELAFRREEIHEFLAGTFLENAQVIEYSIKREDAKKELISALDKMLTSIDPEVDHSISRLSIDRVFTVKGHGTVITGTLIEGHIKVGDTLIHYPSKNRLRIKSIQVHSESVSEAHYGQRVALNLTAELSDLSRGDVLSSSENIPETSIIDVGLKLDDSKIKHWQRVRIYHGTREVLGRVATQGQVEINDTDEHIVQIRLESTLFCKANDPVILRNFSPLYTLGGGKIINPSAKKHHFTDGKLSITDEILSSLQQEEQPFTLKAELFHTLPYPIVDCENAFKNLVEEGLVLKLDENSYALEEWMDSVLTRISTELIGFHNENPLRPGIDRETLRSRINGQMPKNKQVSKWTYQLILGQMEKDGHVFLDGQTVKDSRHVVTLGSAESKWVNQTIQQIESNGPKPTPIKELITSQMTKKTQEELLYHLINSEILVKINEEVVILKSHYELCIKKLYEHFENHEEISVADYRDLMDLSRKGSVELLEHFDRIQLTRRMENTRILLKKRLE